jgi:hypothetical protein
MTYSAVARVHLIRPICVSAASARCYPSIPTPFWSHYRLWSVSFSQPYMNFLNVLLSVFPECPKSRGRRSILSVVLRGSTIHPQIVITLQPTFLQHMKRSTCVAHDRSRGHCPSILSSHGRLSMSDSRGRSCVVWIQHCLRSDSATTMAQSYSTP